VTESAQPDTLRRFLFETEQIRGSIVRLNDTWAQILAGDDYPVQVQSFLGEALAATALLGRNLKFDGRLTLQVQGSEHVRLLVLQCDNQLRLRGLARVGDVLPDNFVDLVNGASLCVSIESTRKAQRYQSIVPLSESTFAECLAHYYQQSVQLPSLFLLDSDSTQAVGIMFQALPERRSGSGRWQQLEEEIQNLDVARMCRLDDQTLLGALFPEEDIRLFDAEPAVFHCDCSLERIEKMLCMLGEAELKELLGEQDPVEVRCEFCNQLYEVPGDKLRRIIAELASASAKAVH